MSEVNRESILEVCREWKGFWMDQTQNSEEDRKNYFNRACGVDANMIHHLADKINEHVSTLQSALLKAEAQNKVLREQRDKAIDESWGNPVGAHNEISRLNAEVEGA